MNVPVPGYSRLLRTTTGAVRVVHSEKLVVVRTLINHADVVPWEVWKPDVKVKVGTWALRLRYRVFWVVYRGHYREGRKTVNYVIPAPEFLCIKDSIMEQCELFSLSPTLSSLNLMTGPMTGVVGTI